MKLNAPNAIIPITLSWIVGIIISYFWQISFLGIILLNFVFLSSLFIKKFRNTAIILSFLALAFLRANLSQYSPQNHLKEILKTKSSFQQPIKGRIVSEITFNGKRNSAVLELIEINKIPVTGKINFSFDDNYLKYGDVIETIAFVEKYQAPSNPFSFDYAEFLEFKQIFAKGYPKSVIKINGNKSSVLNLLVITTRSWLRNRIKSRFGEYSGFIQAILLGEKQNLAEWKQKLNYAGLSHILAVSGLHVGILSLVFFLILKIIFRNRFLSRILLIIILFFYAAICGWSPSVTRAVIMISLYLIAKMIQRKPNANNILAASLLMITIFSPKQLFSIGLQLSYIAVFILLNILPRISFLKFDKEDWEVLSFGKKVTNGILTLMFSSAIISICLAPVTMYYFHQFNLNGIVANLIAIPLIAIILPLCFLIILLPNFLMIYYFFSFKFLMIIFVFWSNLSAFLPLHFDFMRFNLWQFLLSLFLIFFYPLMKYFSYRKISYIVVIIFILNISISFIHFGNDLLKITFFDCDVGDMFLIETQCDEIMMIDTGPPEFSQKHFKYSALSYLQKKGISQIDWLIITHAHNDHYGGLEFILKNLQVKNLIVTDDFQNRSIWKYITNFLDEKTQIITVNDTLNIPLSRIKCHVLHPDKNYCDNNINNMSIVVHLDFDELQVLFTGDIEDEGEKYLVEKYCDKLDADILKIGHHGSKTSSTIEFIRCVSPEFAFIPTSMRNKFNFPHKITLEKYEFLGDHLFIAGKDGALQVSSNGKSADFRTFLSNKIFFASELK